MPFLLPNYRVFFRISSEKCSHFFQLCPKFEGSWECKIAGAIFSVHRALGCGCSGVHTEYWDAPVNVFIIVLIIIFFIVIVFLCSPYWRKNSKCNNWHKNCSCSKISILPNKLQLPGRQWVISEIRCSRQRPTNAPAPVLPSHWVVPTYPPVLPTQCYLPTYPPV